MKFVIEAIGVKSGGGLEVALNLLRRFGRSPVHDVVALVPGIPEYDELDGRVCRVVRFPSQASLLRRRRLLAFAVPRICRQERADALLCLGNFAPPSSPCPAVVLLQNAWYLYDEPVAWRRLSWREKWIVGYGKKWLASRGARWHMIVQTPVMQRRLAALRAGDHSAISVIPAASPLPLPPLFERKLPQARSNAPFNFLCLSRYAAHKNFEILVDAVRLLRHRNPRPFRCLLTIGPEQHPGARKLLERIRRAGLEDLLVNRGPVSRVDLPGVLAQADAHLLPTLLETAGLTFLEAMQLGLPILTSDRDFAREVCRDAAVYFDPLDAASVARAMSRIMEDGELRARLAASGRRILSHAPTWDDVAARFLDLLERVAAGQPVPAPHPAEVGLIQAGERVP